MNNNKVDRRMSHLPSRRAQLVRSRARAVPLKHATLLRWAVLATGSLLVLAASRGFASESASHLGPQSTPGHETPTGDRATRATQAMPAGVTKISTARYTIPAVKLVRATDEKLVSLRDEIDDGRATVLNFIFTTCSSTCPVMSAVLAQFQRDLGADRDKVHLMSISIDPEEDTPQRLNEYARKMHAEAGWQHYTGTIEASLAAQRAFDVYRGDKMSHVPATFLRAGPGKPWRRIDGFVTPAELLSEYRQLHEDHPAVASR